MTQPEDMKPMNAWPLIVMLLVVGAIVGMVNGWW